MDCDRFRCKPTTSSTAAIPPGFRAGNLVVRERNFQRRQTGDTEALCAVDDRKLSRAKISRIATNNQFYSSFWLGVLIFAIIRYTDASCIGENCQNFECDSDRGSKYRAMDYFDRPGRTVFDRPCRCEADWKRTFCETTYPNPSDQLHWPNICICRQLSDSGKSCQQFMTRCYKSHKHELQSCHCCFNQPGDHCNHLPCRRGQPMFGNTANTTCICFGADEYPNHICRPGGSSSKFYGSIDPDNIGPKLPSYATVRSGNSEYQDDSDGRDKAFLSTNKDDIWSLDKIADSKDDDVNGGSSRRRDVEHMQVFGVRVNVSRRMAVGFLVALLVLIAILLMTALIVNGWRMRRRTKSPTQALASAGDGTLLKRCPTDDTCYVPSSAS